MTHTARFIPNAKDAAQILGDALPKAARIWIATAWASDGTEASRALWRARERIQALVVGLDFHQTDPAFLRRFRPYAHVHQVADGTFHPKIYLLQIGVRFRCILGSSNFTHGGLVRNRESNVLIEGSTRDKFFLEIVAYIERARDEGRLMTESEVDAYEVEAQKVADAVKRARTLRLDKASRSTTTRFDLGWEDYVKQLIRAAARNKLDLYSGYVGVTEELQKLWVRHGNLATMPREERRKVAGLDWNYGYFGGMWGAGRFQQLVNERPRLLDKAVDRVPASPALVTKKHFDAFVRNLPALGVAVASGSRLLAMKRPDLFMCVDTANRRRLSETFGFPSARMNTWAGYYELHERLWQFSWFKNARPKGKQGRLWDARVALIDALYYEPKPRA